MSWLYSRALVEGYLGASCSDGERSVPLRSTPTAQAFLWPDRMTAFSSLSRYGMTCGPLTGGHGEGLLTWFLEVSRAKTLAAQEKAQELTENEADCGENLPASLAKFDPDTSSWRTHQFSLFEGLEEFSETWPRWGMMRGGECWALMISVPHMGEHGYGLWPTPLAADGSNGGPNQRGGKGDLRLSGAARHRATPCTPNGGRTNRQEDIANKGKRANGKKVQVSSESQAKAWGTPTARDHKDSGNCSNVPDNGLLGRMVKRWSGTTEQSGSLNPDFHLWLMGWPEGWNDLEPLATDRFRQWLRLHGGYSADEEGGLEPG
jgi:hypothetical protein